MSEKKRQNFLSTNKYRYLPQFMRDFHDQKDLFKSVEQNLGREEEPYAVPWSNAHCYVIDRFLRFMAAHGYTLQRCRVKDVEFADIFATIQEDQLKREEQFQKELQQMQNEAK
jgi:hypothetical protein